MYVWVIANHQTNGRQEEREQNERESEISLPATAIAIYQSAGMSCTDRYRFLFFFFYLSFYSSSSAWRSGEERREEGRDSMNISYHPLITSVSDTTVRSGRYKCPAKITREREKRKRDTIFTLICSPFPGEVVAETWGIQLPEIFVFLLLSFCTSSRFCILSAILFPLILAKVCRKHYLQHCWRREQPYFSFFFFFRT